MDAAKARLPAGVTPTLGPDATGVGWVFEYALVDRSGRHDLAELRSLQDWNLRYALASVPGVAEVASVGGFVRQYQVQVDPERLRALRDPAARRGRGGARLEPRVGRRRARDRGARARGPRPRLRARRSTTSSACRCARAARRAGVPARRRRRCAFGPDMRRGLVELDGEGEAVGGIVVMRCGENALARDRRGEGAARGGARRACPRASRSSPPTTARS